MQVVDVGRGDPFLDVLEVSESRCERVHGRGNCGRHFVFKGESLRKYCDILLNSW